MSAGLTATRTPAAREGVHLLLGRPLAAGDDRPGVTHPPPRRGGLAGDEADDGLGEGRLDVGRGLVLGRAADLADQDHGLGPGILLEELQELDVLEPDDRVAADADGRRLAVALPRDLLDGLVGQGPGPGNDADRARFVDGPGHDPDLGLARAR